MFLFCPRTSWRLLIPSNVSSASEIISTGIIKESDIAIADNVFSRLCSPISLTLKMPKVMPCFKTSKKVHGGSMEIFSIRHVESISLPYLSILHFRPFISSSTFLSPSNAIRVLFCAIEDINLSKASLTWFISLNISAWSNSTLVSTAMYGS